MENFEVLEVWRMGELRCIRRMRQDNSHPLHFTNLYVGCINPVGL